MRTLHQMNFIELLTLLFDRSLPAPVPLSRYAPPTFKDRRAFVTAEPAKLPTEEVTLGRRRRRLAEGDVATFPARLVLISAARR